MTQKTFLRLPYAAGFTGMVLLVIGVAQALVTSNIDETAKWAWSSNAGWVNFKPANGGVVIYADHLEGYAWAENIGWIRLGTYTDGGTHTYGNTSKTDYGVNRSGGSLSGYAWSANTGWIKFDPSHGGVTIDSAGSLDGYAWSENIGWIHFKGTATDRTVYNVAVAAASVTGYTPAEAGQGDTVTINGNGFTGATAVSFGGVSAESFTVDSDIQIRAVLGAGASGAVSVTTPGNAPSKDGFTYLWRAYLPLVVR